MMVVRYGMGLHVIARDMFEGVIGGDEVDYANCNETHSVEGDEITESKEYDKPSYKIRDSLNYLFKICTVCTVCTVL